MEDVKQKADVEVSDSISLMISILLRYPQLGSIKLDPESKLLKFTFILSGLISDAEINNFQKDFKDSEEAFFWLNKVKQNNFEVNFQFLEEFTLIEVRRDLETLCQEEIALMVALFLKHFEDSIITEDNEGLLEEDLLAQEELIEQILETLKIKSEEKPLIAYREEGRVLVFDK